MSETGLTLPFHPSRGTATNSDTPRLGSSNEQGDRDHGQVARLEDSRVSNDAYIDAWSQLGTDDKKLLTDPVPIRGLLEQLDATDRNHESESFFKRGRISAGLQSVENVCNYLDLLSDFLPAPTMSAALGLIKGVIAVSTALCRLSNFPAF